MRLPTQTRTWAKYQAKRNAKKALCPRCPTLSAVVYDRSPYTVKDAPILDEIVFLLKY